MSSYNVDNVTVSLSRLALAKAIKTPDEEDGSDAEPWIKSVIFHQSHVSDSMRDSIENPGARRSSRPLHQQQHPRPRSQLLLQSELQQQQQQQQQRPMEASQRRRTRSSSQFLESSPQLADRTRSDTEMRIEHYRQSTMMNSITPRTVGSTTTSDNLSSLGMSQLRAPAPKKKQQLESEDENDDDESEDSDDDSGTSASTPAARKSSTNLVLSGHRVSQHLPAPSDDEDDDVPAPTPAARKSSTNLMLSGRRASQHLPAPSDDDDDDDDESDTSAPTPAARKSSTNLMPTNHRVSQHLPPPSDDEDDDDDASESQDDDDSEEEEVIQSRPAAIAKRTSAMILGNTTASSEDENLKARRMSTLRQLERGPSMHRRSRSSGDINLIAQLQQQQHQTENPYVEDEVSVAPSGKYNAIERWRQVVSVMAEVPQPETLPETSTVTTTSTTYGKRSSAVPPGYRRNRRSTMGEMDAMYNPATAAALPMQWQMQHAQQMAQIQQYQNSAMMLAPPPPQSQVSASTGWSSSMGNRRSISAMDMLENLEREKQESRKNKKNEKRLDSSKAPIEGLLGQLSSKSTHTLSFQQLEQEGGGRGNINGGGGIGYGYQQHLMRASQSDMDLSRLSQQRRSRSPGPERALRPDNHHGNKSNKKMSSTDARRRSEMIRSESAPRLSSSKSTPLNEQNRQSMLSMQTPMYGQLLAPYGMGMPMAAQAGPMGGMMPMNMGMGMMAPPQMMTPPPASPMMMASSASTGRVRNNNNRRPSTGNWAQGYQ